MILDTSLYTKYKPGLIPENGFTRPAYWFGFHSNKLFVLEEQDNCSLPLVVNVEEIGLRPVRSQYLGMLEEKPCYCAEVGLDPDTLEIGSFRELRSLYGCLPQDIFLLAGRAIQIVAWDQTNQYCGRCGHVTETLTEERAKKCPACGFISYPRLSPAVITAVFKENKILLACHSAFRSNIHTLIAGFVEPGESLEECMSREIFEEVGLKVKNARYFGSQPWPFPNSLMLGFTAEWAGGEIKPDGKEISGADWYGADNLPGLPPKMSIAREIIDCFALKGATYG